MAKGSKLKAFYVACSWDPPTTYGIYNALTFSSGPAFEFHLYIPLS
jgi:hypothetical protein